MSKVTHLVQWIPLLYMCFFLIIWIKIYNNELIEFDEFVLEKQVNYAADAAVEELLMTGDTDQDYNKGEYIVVEPDLALQEFTSIITEDFNLVPTEFTNAQVQEQYIKALVICTWDGFYTYWYQPKDSQNIRGFVGTPKVPYFYTDKDGRQYCLNLGFETAYSDNGLSGDDYKINNIGKIDIPKHIQLTSINNQVADALNYALIQAYGGSSTFTVDIPALASDVSGKQPVDQITVLGVVEGQSVVNSSAVIAECIGGAQITKADPVIGVTVQFKSGLKADVYAYSSYWRSQKDKIFYDSVNNKNSRILGAVSPDGSLTTDITSANYDFFDTPFEAASAGYYDLFTTMDDGIGNMLDDEESEEVDE